MLDLLYLAWRLEVTPKEVVLSSGASSRKVLQHFSYHSMGLGDRFGV